jgi:hypothetical protein
MSVRLASDKSTWRYQTKLFLIKASFHVLDDLPAIKQPISILYSLQHQPCFFPSSERQQNRSICFSWDGGTDSKVWPKVTWDGPLPLRAQLKSYFQRIYPFCCFPFAVIWP